MEVVETSSRPPPRLRSDGNGIARTATEIFLVAALYGITSFLGQHVAIPPGNITPIFPSAGIALVALRLRGTRLWPGVWLGSWLGNSWLLGHPAHPGHVTFVTISGIATGATLQALFANAILVRYVGTHNPVRRTNDIFRFALGSGMVACFVNSTIGPLSLLVGGFIGWAEFSRAWWTWWIGDTTGVLVVGAVLFTWAQPPSRDWLKRVAPEGLGAMLLLISAGAAVFGPWSPLAVHHVPVLPLFLPPLVWIALRVGRHGVAVASIILAAAALWGTTHDLGPLAYNELNEALFLYDGFVSMTTLTALALAATVEERSDAEAALTKARDELEIRVAEQTQELRRTNEEILSEVRDRTRAETAQRESEARLHALIDSLPFDIWAVDREGRTVVQNDAARQNWGDILGKEATELDITPEQRDAWLSNSSRGMAGETLIMRGKRETSDGRTRHYLNVITPIRVGSEIIGTGGVDIDISDRVLYEEALHSSEQTYRSIFQAVTDGIVVHDIRNGAILDVNDRFCEMYGRTHDEVRSMSIGELSNAEAGYTQEGALRQVQRAVAGELPSFEWQGKHSDGHVFWVEVSLSRATISGKDRLLAIVRDISDRKQAQDELREQAARLRLVAEQIPAILWTTDRSLVVASAAGAGLARLNAPSEQLIGSPASQLVRKSDWIAYGRVPHEKALAGESTVLEAHWNDRTYEMRVEPLRDGEERIVGVIGLALDVTDRNKLAQERQTFEQHLRLVLEHTPVILFAIDRDCRFTISEGKGLQLLGMKPGEVVGRSVYDVYREEPGLIAHALRALAGEEYTSIDTIDRLGLTWETSWAPIRNHQGVLEGSAGIATDVTDRVRAQRERDQLLNDEREARLSAEEAVRVRDDFLSIASHELKTPITALQYSVQALTKLSVHNGLAKVPPQTLAVLFETIERQGKRLNRLVNVLLDVSRLDAGRFELAVEPLDLAALTREVAGHLSEELQRSGCALQITGVDRVVGDWDRFRMEQVITNLLSNAMKYGAQKPIAVTVDAAPTEAVLTVTDHGIGIAPEQQEVIFRRFERAVSAQHYSGLGLGLYIARRIVEAHGGTIRVFSSPNQGSTFVVSLPYQPQLRVRPDHVREERDVPNG